MKGCIVSTGNQSWIKWLELQNWKQMLRIELDIITITALKFDKNVSKKDSIGLNQSQPSETVIKMCIGLKKKRKKKGK